MESSGPCFMLGLDKGHGLHEVIGNNSFNGVNGNHGLNGINGNYGFNGNVADPTKICQICTIKAKGDEKFYNHYGAVCCYSCKAFFRRYTRGEIKAKECKEGNQCEINLGRKNCKPCRYRKCLAFGMSTDNLLNEEDRKKYTHPKKNKKVGSEEIIKCFDEAIGKIEYKMDDLYRLISAHRGMGRWTIEDSVAFLNVMDTYESFFANFAETIQAFQCLPKSDQDLLLHHNGKLFKEYLIVRCLTDNLGSDQLDWILGLNDIVKITDSQNLIAVNFELVNREGAMISSNNLSLSDQYCKHLATIKTYFQIRNDLTPFIGYHLLFSTKFKDSKYLEQLEKIKHFEEASKSKFEAQFGIADGNLNYMDSLVTTLQSMVLLKQPELVKPIQIQSQKCSSDEEAWINGVVKCYFSEVAPNTLTDWNYIENYRAFNNGVPHVRHKLVFESTCLTIKRMTVMAKRFGMDVLIPPEKAAMVVMLGGAKADTFKTVGENIKFASGWHHLGEQEEMLMRKPNKPFIYCSGIRKAIDPELFNEYENAWKSVGNFLSRHDLYILSVLDIIFTGLNETWSNAIKTLIFKRITDYCGFPAKQSAPNIYKQYMDDVQTMGRIQTRIMYESLMDPESLVGV